MTERDQSPDVVVRPDLEAELRRVLDQIGQAERILVGVTSRLDEVAKQVTPPNPPPPPPWREILTRLEVVIESSVATSLRARRDVQVIIQRLPGGPAHQ